MNSTNQNGKKKGITITGTPFQKVCAKIQLVVAACAVIFLMIARLLNVDSDTISHVLGIFVVAVIFLLLLPMFFNGESKNEEDSEKKEENEK